MTEKRTPTFVLSAVKQAFSGPESLNRTFSAAQGAEDLGLNNSDVVAVVQNLTSKDFYKSMTSKTVNTVWQDVYKPSYKGTRLYVKFTLNACRQLLIISFKEA